MIRDGYRVDEGAIGKTCGWGRGGVRCGAFAFRARGKSAYCLKHHRFHQMRKEAKSRGLLVPTWQQLEWLLPVDMVCHECDEPMIWTAPAGSTSRGATISLQHYRDGSFGLIHHRCNVIHGKLTVLGEHDRLPEGMKACPRCEKILSIESFRESHCRPSGREAYCLDCRRDYGRMRYLQKRALPSALFDEKQSPNAVFYERGSRIVPPIKPSRDEPA